MAKFNSLKVKDVRKETADCVSIAFDVPDELKKDYTFIQGQYLTLKITIYGEEVRRSYSICTSPLGDEELRIASKVVPGGKMSSYLFEKTKPGDSIEVMIPMGNFHSEVKASNKKNYLLFAGGSGVTPMLSILKTILAVEKESAVKMFYANRDEASIIFKKELDALKEEESDRFQLFNILDNAPSGHDALLVGIMTEEKVKELFSQKVDLNSIDEIFICGPGAMMANVVAILADLKVDPKKVHVEYFSAVLDDLKKAEEKNNLLFEGKEVTDAAVTIILDGEETVLKLSTKGKSVLDAAEAANLDVPFSCKGAVCCTCKAKVMEGSARMDQNYALTEAEIAEGYILTCQAHPTAEKVTISYDEV